MIVNEGWPCPHCQANKTRVVDSRKIKRGQRRRRVCRSCGFRFGTVEMDAIMLLKLKQAILLLPEDEYMTPGIGATLKEMVDRLPGESVRPDMIMHKPLPPSRM